MVRKWRGKRKKGEATAGERGVTRRKLTAWAGRTQKNKQMGAFVFAEERRRRRGDGPRKVEEVALSPSHLFCVILAGSMADQEAYEVRAPAPRRCGRLPRARARAAAPAGRAAARAAVRRRQGGVFGEVGRLQRGRQHLGTAGEPRAGSGFPARAWPAPVQTQGLLEPAARAQSLLHSLLRALLALLGQLERVPWLSGGPCFLFVLRFHRPAAARRCCTSSRRRSTTTRRPR